MAATSTTPATGGVEKLVKVYKYFDLSNLTQKTKEVTADFTPAASVEEGSARLADEKLLLGAINDRLRKLTLAQERKKVVSEGASKTAVLKLAAGFRQVLPFSAMLETGANGKPTRESKVKQTRAILDAFLTMPFILESLKATSAVDDDDDEEGDDE